MGAARVMASLALAGLLSAVVSVSVQQAAVDQHNQIRRTEAKANHATNLYELVWDADLARTATNWAKQCKFEHQDSHAFGENLYYTYPRRHADDYYVQRALRSWYTGEKTDNGDHSFDCCYHGHYSCCHYSQVVASRTRKVGCSVAHCDTISRDGHPISRAHDVAFVVCDYSPPGNIAHNGHHEAYETGTLCSGCAAGDHCNDGLCVAS